jgi:hypothetical protein
MIIKKWSGSAWQNQAPKTTASQIFTDTTFATSIFENNKVKVAYLPNEVFDSLRFGSVISSSATAGEFAEYLQEAFDSVVDGSARTMVGVYLVAGSSLSIANQTTGIQGTVSLDEYWRWTFLNEDGGVTGAPTSSGTMEAGDWVVVESITGLGTFASPFILKLSIVNNTYEIATATTNGIVKLFSSTSQSVAANAVSATTGRTYGIQNNASGQLVVNVPWADTNTTYTAGTGLTLSGTTFAADLIDMTLRSVTAESITTTASRTYAVMPDADGDLVVNVPWVDTNTTYGKATTTTLGLVETAFADLGSNPTITATSTSDRYYGVQLNQAQQMVVNVPWVDTNTTYSAATDASLGLVLLSTSAVQTVAKNTISNTASRTYGVQNDDGGQLVVNVPWSDTNTTYGKATSTVLGLVELFSNTVQTVAAAEVSATASRTYGIQLNSADQAVVNVPWVNTTYSAGNGIALSTTTFSVAAGEGLTQEASGLRETFPLYVQTATPTTAVTNAIWYDIN